MNREKGEGLSLFGQLKEEEKRGVGGRERIGGLDEHNWLGEGR